MSDLYRLIWCALIGLFRPRAALEAEVLVLRHQLNVLRRKSPKRVVFGNVDRLVFTALYRVAPGVLDALKILKPQTVIRWHRDHLWRGVDCHDVAAAASGDEGCAASARADIDQPITGRHIEAIERVSCEGVRERLKHLFVHRNVIVPEFGVLVWLELRR